MLSATLIATLAGASSALALSYHGQQPAMMMHKRALGAVAAVGTEADHLKRDFFGPESSKQPSRMARRVNKNLNRRAATVYSTTANYYATTGGYSACHTYFGDDDMVIALPTGLYPEVTEVSPYCGKTVLATNPATGVSVTLTVQDASWAAEYVTLPKGAFLALGGTELNGEVAITYSFTDASIVAPSSTSAADVTVSTAGRANKVASHASASSSASVEATASSSAAPAPTTESEVKVASPTKVAVKAAVTPTPETSEAPATPTYDSASAASASKASAAAAAQASADAKAAADKAAADKAAADKAAADQAQAAAAEASQAAAASQAQAAEAAASSSKAAAAAAATATKAPAQNNGGGGTYTGGFATYFYQNGVAGNCGTVASDNEKVIALPTAMYAGGSHCGQQIRLTRTDNGNSVVATVRDSCPTCVNNESLDLSVGAFTAIASESEGMVPISWSWA